MEDRTKHKDASAIAAKELVTYTGDKTQGRKWQVGDSIAALADKGTSKVPSWAGRTVRGQAVNASGHGDFLSASRLTKLGQIALDWPAADRVAGVSIDAHGEALAGCGGDRAKAAQALAEIKKLIADGTIRSKTGYPSIRNVRDHLGLNGGTKSAPKPIDLSSIDSVTLFVEVNIRLAKKGDLFAALRRELNSQAPAIKAVHQRTGELLKVMEDIAAAGSKPAPKPPAKKETAAAPKTKTGERKKKGRIAGL